MEDEILRLQRLVDQVLINRSDSKILEAGCGSMMHIHFGEKAHIIGIDISEMQLSRNRDIDEKIIGDIQTYDFQSSSFDIIICWNVLEHLLNPLAALSGFAKAIKQDGTIILGLPNVLSIKGLITKYTPHNFHIWVYKHIFGVVDAGKDDKSPFKTVLSYTIAPTAIKRFAHRYGLKVIYFASYDTEFFLRRLGPFFSVFKQLIKYLSFGWLGDSDFIIALQKE